jgi:S1/P1 Nuclease
LRSPGLILAALTTVAPVPAGAWGDLGHNVTALIAYRHLLPQSRARLDALLASDTDPLTAPDFAARAAWADKYRNAHRETAAWRFVDIEIDQPDLAIACFGFPPLAKDQIASQGTAQDCVVNKVDEFTGELANPATAPAERLLALKFLIHFISDLHQPLHAADHQDRGGNCVGLAMPIDQTTNLHAYWDVAVVDALGPSAAQIADQLDASLDAAQIKNWSQGTPRSWALETFEVGRRDTYAIPSKPTCQNSGSVSLTDEYQAQARKDAAEQLSKAAVRLAAVLNAALSVQ